MPGRTHNDKLIVKIDFHDVCKALLNADPDIRDIILFVDDLERAASDSQNPVNIEGNGNVS